MNRKEIFGSLLVLGLFIIVAYFANLYQQELPSVISGESLWEILFYIGITVVAVVIAPVSTFPLLPLAVVAWGSFAAAIYSIIGWTIGGVIAFILARKYGKPFVSKYVGLEKIQNISQRMPKHNLFWSIVLLRMVIPVDILSYVIGLFVPISLFRYTIATIIGVSPFAFVFAYASALPIIYQIGAGILALFAIGVGLWQGNKNAH